MANIKAYYYSTLDKALSLQWNLMNAFVVLLKTLKILVTKVSQ